MFVRDLRGREWVVRRTFAPWWRMVQPGVVLGIEDRQLRSLTVLLVRGGRRHTNALVQGIAATLVESDRAYDPENLPKTVTVVSQKGFWR